MNTFAIVLYILIATALLVLTKVNTFVIVLYTFTVTLLVLAKVIDWYTKYDLEKLTKEVTKLKEIISFLNRQIIVLRNLGTNRRYVVYITEEQKSLVCQMENRIIMLKRDLLSI